MVTAAGIDPAYGLFVLLRHTQGYETMYGHASRLLVREGDSVQAGQVIALSGTSGRSTAPHLHFEIRRDGRSLDPLTVVKQENWHGDLHRERARRAGGRSRTLDHRGRHAG